MSLKPVRKLLFGGQQCLASSIFFPIRLDLVERWYGANSGVTRNLIAEKNTMHPYMTIVYPDKFRQQVDAVINGAAAPKTFDKTGTQRSHRLWPKYLRYCPDCVRDDVEMHGETYWHRVHQLPAMTYCTKHRVRLYDSNAEVTGAHMGFHPASAELLSEYSREYDCLEPHKEQFIRIGLESEWLLQHGAGVDWDFDLHAKYKRLFRDKGIATIQGISDYDLIVNVFEASWGQDFLNCLRLELSDNREWIRQIYEARMISFKPIYHILLMGLLCGSVKAFLEYEPPENPFGEGPWPCENPICKHYRADGCRNTEIRYVNGVATGFFECEVCGMVYKQVKRKGKTGDILIVDYGDVWEKELLRCLGDEKMTIPETAAALKCEPHVVGWQKKKKGLRKKNDYTAVPRRYDAETDGEAFYKAQVLKIREQYDEVTFSMLRKLAPGAYSYLSKHDVAWLRNYLIHESARAGSRELDKQLLSQVQNAVDWIKKNGDSNRQLTYGYIASIAGAKEHELKYARLKRPLTKAFLDTVIESREDWLRRRIVTIWQDKQDGKPLSLSDLKREMSIKPNTYVKYKNLIEQLINELNLELL